VQGRRELAIIDPATDSVVERIALPGARGNHGLLIEAQRRLAFIACEDDDTLLVLDLKTARITGKFSVGGEPDVLAYDAALGMLYVAGEAGLMSVFSVTDRGVSKRGDVAVGADAHSVAVDPATHEIYLPLENVRGSAVMRVIRPRP
jgi:DNA-binding beta-propeller fold protein YncE